MYKKTESNNLLKGLVLDTAKQNQPKDSYSYALNATNETKEGDVGFLSNEPGNSVCSSFLLPQFPNKTFYPIGHVNLLNNEILLFLATEDKSESVIAIYKGDCEPLQVVVGAPCFNFSVNHQIKATYRIRKGCNRTVYFVDYYNPDRVVDIDEIINNPLDNKYLDSNGDFDCTLTKIAPDFVMPKIEYLETNDSGGSLRYGTYEFAISLGDEDLNFSTWVDVTNPIPIVNGILDSDINKIEGGDPSLTPTVNTGKSISLNFTNLDPKYDYIKIAVIETVGGVTTAYEVDTLAYTGLTDLPFTYTGVDYNSAKILSLTDIATPRIIYDTSYTIEQQDNRLIRGNIKEKNVDYASFQIAANEIKSKYVTKPIKYTSQQSMQSGSYYFDNRSYLRDEIYALGIKGIWKDGSETPVFHIPGRALDTNSNGTAMPASSDINVFDKIHNRKLPINGWDSTKYDVVFSMVNYGNAANATQVSMEDARPFNYGVGTQIDRWRVFNTALREELYTLNDSIYSKGQLAYWQSEYSYPLTKDCTGDFVYPTGKIRHHKMPDTTLEPHHINATGNQDDNYVLPLGLEFDLTAFIATLQARIGATYNNLQGFKIVRAKRDRDNKSILDKGIAFNNWELQYDGSNHLIQTDLFNRHGKVQRVVNCADSPYISTIAPTTLFNINNGYTATWDQLPYSSAFNGSTSPDNGLVKYSVKSMTLHSPRGKFNPSAIGGQYIKMEKELWGNYECFGAAESWTTGCDDGPKARASFVCEYKSYSSNPAYKGTPRSNFTNRAIEYKNTLGINQNLGTLPFNFVNKFQQEGYALYLKDDFFNIMGDGAYYGGSPTDYVVATDAATGANEIATGYYISVKNYKPTLYNQLHNLIYHEIDNQLIPTNGTTITMFGGDTFISMLSFRKTYLDQTYIDDDECTAWQNLAIYFVESEINCKLRHRLTQDESDYTNTYYPYHGTDVQAKKDVLFNNDFQLAGGNTTDDMFNAYKDGNIAKSPFNYNKDYSKEVVEKPCFPLPLGFDYCSECLNKFPHRLVYSVKSYQEETNDNYLKFLANSYRDLQGNTGEVTDMFRKSDELFIRTKYSLWALQTKPQEMKTNTGSVFISTGEFFEVPPKELISNKTGYAGGQTRWDLVVNEYGATFVDQSLGMIYNYSDTLNEISDSGIRHWLEQNLPCKLLEVKPDFPYYDNPASKIGVGLLGYYDPVKRRYILTKKDYVPIDPANTTFIESNNTWDVNTGFVHYIVSNPYDYPQYFEDKSWTLSYSFESKGWVSYHSYTPNYAFYNRDTFCTSIVDDTNIWKHGEGEYQSFYGTVYPHIFEYVVNEEPQTTKTYDSTKYVSSVTKYNSSFEDYTEITNKTYDKALFYNDTQSTGIIDVLVKDTSDPFSSVAPYDPATIQACSVESTWNINGMRDMVQQGAVKQPIFVKNWSNIANSYPIDKVPNMNIITYLKSQFDIERFRDNYMAVRMFFTNPENHKIVTKYIMTNTKKSLR